MTTMTIHADDYLAEAIRKAAFEAGQSINVFIKETLGSSLGISVQKKRKPAFLDCLPEISSENIKELESVQHDFDVIDEELWK